MTDDILAHIENIMPFYLVINQDCIITYAGRTVKVIEPDIIGTNFCDLFSIDNTTFSECIEDLKKLKQYKVLVRNKNIIQYCLKGEFYFIENQNCFYFVGSPDWATYKILMELDMPITKFWNYLKPEDIVPIFEMWETLVNSYFNVIAQAENQKKQLAKETQKYLDVIDTLDEIIFQTDNDGNWTFLNKAWEKIMGFTVSESINTLFFQYLHPDDVQKNWELFVPLINKEKSYCNHRIRYISRSKEVKWIRVYAKLIIDENNETIGTAGTLLDVTREMENEQLLSLVLDNMRDEIALIDKDNQYRFASPSLLKNRGYESLEDLQKHTSKQNVHTEDLDLVTDGLFTTEKKEQNVDYRIKLKDGEMYWYNGSFINIVDKSSDEPYLLVVARNVNDKKKVEDQLSLILNNVQDEITMGDLEGNYIFASPSAIKNRGYDNFEDFKNSNVLKVITQGAIEEMLPELRNKNYIQKELLIKLKDGRMVWYEHSIRLFYDETTNKELIINISRNIEEKRKTEQQLKFLLDNVTDELTMIGLDGHYIYATPSAIKNRGYKDLEEMKQIKVPDLFQPGVAVQLLEMLTQNDEVYWEGLFKLNTGEFKWYSFSFRLVFDEIINQKILISISRNIEERKQQEKKFELITNNMTEEITMFDFAGNYIYASPSAIKNRNYKDFDEMKMVNAFSLFDIERIASIKESLINTGECKLENRVYYNHIGFVWYEINNKVIIDEVNNKHYILSVSRNINERKTNQQQLELITQNLTDEITMFDLDGNYFYASPSAIRNRLYNDFEDFKKKNALSYLSKEGKEEMIQSLKTAGTINIVRQLVYKNGEKVWYDSNLTLASDNFSRKEYVVVVARNIQEKKQMETQLDLITNNLTDEITMFDLEGNYFYATPSAIKNRHFKNFDDFKKVNALTYFSQEDKAIFLNNLRTTGSNKVERLFRMNNGEKIWYDSNATLITDTTNDKQYVVVVARNIHEKKLMQNQLDLITQNITDEITMFDFEGNYLYASPSAINNRGFADFNVMKTHNAFEKFNDELLQIIKKEINENGRRKIEGKFEMKKGVSIWYEIEAKLIIDETSDQQYILCVSRNIEERKMHEQQLELVTNNISDEITMFDLTGRYSYASPSAIQNRGYKNFEEMKKTNALDLYISKEVADANLNKLKKEGIINWEGKFKQSNGIYNWYEATAKLIKDNITGKEYVVAISRNINMRKKYENQLELITTNTIDEITMYDLEGNYLFASPTAIKNRGYADFEDLKTSNIFTKFKEGIAEKFLTDIQQNDYLEFQGLYKLKNGEFKWYEGTSKLVTDENDNKYIITVSRNVEERKKFEEYMELTLKKEQELNQLKSKFISTSSHEFKTPMAIIKNAIEILMGSDLVKTKDGPNPFYEKYLNRIDNEVDRVVSLMNDSLLLEKANNNSLEVNAKPTDIVFKLLDIVEKYNNINNNRKVIIDVKHKPRKINIDPALMDHVFDNLVSNSLKYSEGRKSPEVVIDFQDKQVQISFIDYGIGIPDDALQKLCTPFFRAGNTSGVQGTGMGLSIVKKILDLHSADLNIESELNEGTRVMVTISYH